MKKGSLAGIDGRETSALRERARLVEAP